ncbi:MAG: TolC family protein [Myxococcota bacterium]|nr:TolC family protein [Myxococcota bacterium]
MASPRSLALVALAGAAAATVSVAVRAAPTDAPAVASRGSDEVPAGRPPTPPESSLRVVTLAEVERTADAQQPQILVARAVTHGAEAQAEQVRAPLLPQLDGSAAYTRQTGNFVARPGVLPSTTASPNWSVSTSFDYWNFGVTGTQLIYDFGQAWQRYRAAEATVDADRSMEGATRLQIRFAARRAYFAARATRELVGVARDTVGQQERHLQQVQAFVQVGTQPEIALAQQRAALANARVQLITAQNNYETAKAQLNQAAGIPGGTDYDVGDEVLPAVDDEEQPLEVLVSKAIAARPELATIARQRGAQEAILSSVRGGYGPTISAAAGASEQGTSLDRLVPNWNAGVLLNWPFFQGGLTRGQVHQAEAGLESLDAQRTLEELQVRLEVDSARLGLRAAKATIGAAQEAETNAREQLRLADQRYATGVGGILELNDAQLAYTAAAAQIVQAHYSLATARAQLLGALGRR